MRMVDLIADKKSGKTHSRRELDFIASGAADGSIPDYQLSAWLMAVCFNGMSVEETTQFTLAMTASGKTADLSGIKGVIADKHSTGGVGDKTTLVVAPIAACCGLKIAKMSGRGLGHTGGTIDKLESIQGLTTTFTMEQFIRNVNDNGLCVGGQSKGMDPADKRLYALRDVTATVNCMPLIASSIMSKKLAGGAKIIVLDVKFGSGSFMKTEEEACELARLMTDIGNNAGRKTVAVITDMDVPLGNSVGNLLEVKEAVEVLRGGGDESLKAVCFTLVKQMLICAGHSNEQADRVCAQAVSSGAALAKLADTVAMQGGQRDWITDTDNMPVAKYSKTLLAGQGGYIEHINTEGVGKAAMLLGAGRAVITDGIDPTAGIVFSRKTADPVTEGQAIATLFFNDENKVNDAYQLLESSIVYSKTGRPKQPPVRRIIT